MTTEIWGYKSLAMTMPSTGYKSLAVTTNTGYKSLAMTTLQNAEDRYSNTLG